MARQSDKPRRFPDAREDLARWDRTPDTPQTLSPSYRLAWNDGDFLTREDMRPVRLQLELLKPELALSERGIASTVVMFGSARIPDPADPGPARPASALAHWYDEAREFARLCTRKAISTDNHDFVVCTGGGPGIMEAGSRGAHDEGGISVSLNIVLPHEQSPNLYGTPDLSFNFHYFAIRKMHFLMRARAIAAFPGGFGTLDELFEVVTLVQTGRMKRLPILLFGAEFWRTVVNWDALVEAGTIAPADLDLLTHVETAEEGWQVVEAWKTA